MIKVRSVSFFKKRMKEINPNHPHMNSTEIHDWNKRPVKYVAKTEQRIVFQEVTLLPKNTTTTTTAAADSKKAKGKGRASTPQNGMESESMSVLPYNGETTMSSSL